MTPDDVITYYLEHSPSNMTASNNKASYSAILEDWTCIYVNKGIAIVGRVHSYPEYPQGQQIQTSMINGLFTKDTHVYVTTQNFIYTLGIPNEGFAGNLELLFDDSADYTASFESNAFDDALEKFFLNHQLIKIVSHHS